MDTQVDFGVLVALAVVREFIVENLDDMGLTAIATYSQLAGKIEEQMGIE